MYAFRLGFLATLLSDPLVSGFTTAAALHVFTSQVKELLGLDYKSTQGNFNLIMVRFMCGKFFQF